MSIDLTDEMMAPAEAVVIGHRALVQHDAIDLAWDTVKAVLPLIEAAVREQAVRDIEAASLSRLLIHPNTARAVKRYMARIARGEQR